MIASPCIDVCKMDEASGLCQGCYRSLAEIAAWGSASDQEKLRVLAAVSQRQGRQDHVAQLGSNGTDC